MRPLITPQSATNSLHLLVEAAVDRAAEVQNHSREGEWSASVEELDLASHIIEELYNEAGPSMFVQMTNFTAQQFNFL